MLEFGIPGVVNAAKSHCVNSVSIYRLLTANWDPITAGSLPEVFGDKSDRRIEGHQFRCGNFKDPDFIKDTLAMSIEKSSTANDGVMKSSHTRLWRFVYRIA